MIKTITIVGGGNSAHVLIPLLSKSQLTVNLLTRKPDKWSNNIELDYIKPNGDFVESMSGEISKISSNPYDLMPQSDIIILCMPVNSYREMLHKIAPFINKNKKVYVGTVYGQGGFNWMCNEIVEKYELDNLVSFAIGLIPWICRTIEYGKKGLVYGAKPVNLVAVNPKSEFNVLNEILLSPIVEQWFGHGSFKCVNHFISLTLSVDNQIIHTSRMYGLYKKTKGIWNQLEDVPLFYKDFSNVSAKILKGLDEDYSAIRETIKKEFKHNDYKWMMDYLTQDNLTNLSSNQNILETFENSSTLGAIKTPVIQMNNHWVLDRHHRFFYDDVFYGLCIAKWFAQELNLVCPHIDDLLMWTQEYLNEPIIENHQLNCDEAMKKEPFKYGIPSVYGFTSIEQVID